MSETLMCARCRLRLEPLRVDFSYMGFEFHETLPKCPSCGQVYLSRELVEGRMRDVETAMEDK